MLASAQEGTTSVCFWLNHELHAVPCGKQKDDAEIQCCTVSLSVGFFKTREILDVSKSKGTYIRIFLSGCPKWMIIEGCLYYTPSLSKFKQHPNWKMLVCKELFGI